MISFLKNLKPNKLKALPALLRKTLQVGKSYPSSRAKLTTGHGKLNKGMTYVEIIVVLSIFSIMTSVILFDYNGFQSKIDIRVLASDIALKLAEAQKSAISGKLPPFSADLDSDWKPAYGIFLNPLNSFDISGIPSNQRFIYFVDYDNGNTFNNGTDPGVDCLGECLENIVITKGNSFEVYACYSEDCIESRAFKITRPLSITFKRPNSNAVFSYPERVIDDVFNHIKIVVSSNDATPFTSDIKIYPSGRIQID